MLRNKSIMWTIVVSACLFVMSGCYKDKTVIIETPADEVTRTVTFAADILPIFKNNCALSGCHVSGGKTPDLSEANALNSLGTGGYLNTGNPESSKLYSWMSGKETTPMPVGGINKDNNALVLAWIKQGALNN